MIVHDFDVARSWRAAFPNKADAPSVVNPCAPLALAISGEFLQPMAREVGDVGQTCRHAQTIQDPLGTPPKRLERFDSFAAHESRRTGVRAAQDHAGNLGKITRYVKRKSVTRQFGKVDIPQEAFIAALKMDQD
jgi:hypothetical protein